MNIREAIPADDPAIVEIGNQLNDQYPRMTVDELREFIKGIPAGVQHRRLVAEQNGQILAHAHLEEKFWVGVKGSCTGTVEVRPEHWEKGLGEALWHHLLESAREFEQKRFYAQVRESRANAVRFVEQRGFTRTGHVTKMSRLDLRHVNFAGYDETEQRLIGQGIRTSTLAELGATDDRVLRELHAVEISTSKDEPSSEPFNVPFERWRDVFLKFPGMSPESMFVALYGDTMVGYTTLRRQGGNGAWSNGMGVEREFRGRGVARLLKLQAIRWAQQNDIDFLYTGNDVENPRMYAINIRLGYEPLPGEIEVVKDLDSAPHELSH